MKLDSAQVDRACGVLLASAAGDALGAGYEFGAARFDGTPRMIGGGLGGFAPGEWTDDTAQAMAIARVAATGADLRSDAALTEIARRFFNWFATEPKDIGIQTRAVFSGAGRHPTAVQMREAAHAVHERTGRSAGNGSLMRTGPVALAHLDDPEGLVEAAMAVSALTHYEDLAREGCALWCLMIRHAVLHGAFPTADDVLCWMPNPDRWQAILAEAESEEPATFSQNGWVVGALQAAWSSVVHTPVPDKMPCRHLQHSLTTAIGIGHDTDTVAAIAGALLGARWGASAVPLEWAGMLHGWGASSAQELVELATLTLGVRTGSGWPACDRVDYADWDHDRAYVAHPLVDGVWIGGALALDELADDIDAVVSLCRVGRTQVRVKERYAVRLIDTVAEDNPNLDFVIDDAARTVLRLRDEGKRVYLHCVASQSRTPTVAARVAVLAGTPLPTALTEVCAALPSALPQRFLREALERLATLDRQSQK